MDTLIEKKKGIKKKHTPYIVIGAFLMLSFGWLIFGDHTPRYSVESQKITINTVKVGEFNDYIRVNGQVQPINVIHLSAVEGGVVAEKVVEEGAMVKKGDIILRLTNSMLSRNILDSEAQLAEKQNFLRNTQVTMEQEKLNLRKERLQLDLDIERKKRKYEQYRELYNEKLVSKEEYLQTKEDYEFAVKSRDLVIERQKQDSIYRGIQVDQMEESLENIRRNLTQQRNRIDDLDIKAPVDGQLGLLEVEIGQSVGGGQRIGLINVLSDYKIEARIDEHYIDRVGNGLTATFERQDKKFDLVLRKVYPEVRDKTFKTDFIFQGDRPDNIRAGQTYYINLQLGQSVEAVIVPRGAFYQSTGGQWIFVVTEDGKKAVRRSIRIGRQNPLYYEVTTGLESGEKVITSTYDSFGDAEELILK